MTKTVYRDEIIEHYKYPQNYGKITSYDKSSSNINPFCGDDITLYIKFTQEKISEIGFTGKGCAISVAAVSMLTEYVVGKKKTELTKMSQEDMLSLLGVPISETRKKCALLGWAVLQDCLK